VNWKYWAQAAESLPDMLANVRPRRGLSPSGLVLMLTGFALVLPGCDLEVAIA
jgi:hypothetical protein